MGNSGTVLGMVSGSKAVPCPDSVSTSHKAAPAHMYLCRPDPVLYISCHQPGVSHQHCVMSSSGYTHPACHLEMPAPCELFPGSQDILRTSALRLILLHRNAPQPCLTSLHLQALKSHDHSTKPLYVSVGHRISLEVAVRLTHHCCRFRIPEPIRQVWGLRVGDWHCHPVSPGVGLCRDLRTGPCAP